LPTSQADEQEQQRAVYQAFVDAVKIRLDSERRVMAFLTGGLDSRCVVAALTGQGIKVNSMNFAADRSQDLILGAQLASALGTNHFSFPMSTTDSVAGRIPVALPKWIDHCQSGGLSADRPHLVWSGDGGSVGLGHVYLTEPMVDDIESGQGKRAVDKVLAELRSNVPVGALKLAYRTQYADALTAGFYEEFDRLVDRHTGRALYTLLMCTDQRRHLHSHFELLGQHQCELQLPYFDRDFVATVMAQPVRSFLLHRFYNRWLNLFQKEVREVPWQAYPGHVPCPIPLQSGLSYQWDTRTPDYFHKFHRAQSLRVLKGIFAGRYSNCELSQTRVVVAAVLTATRLRDYSYVLQFAEAFTHYS
jgi:asparagine synthetase B (glutamine-hydrolysing)